MAPSWYPPDTLFKIVVKGTQGSSSAYVNVHHFWMYATTDIADTTLRTAIYDHFYDLFYSVRDSLTSNVRWNELFIYYKRPTDTEWLEQGQLTLNFQGNDTGDDLPSGVSAQVTGVTQKAKRRGRKFLPPFGELYNDNQAWTALGLQRLVAYALQYLAGREVGNALGWLFPIVMEGATFLWNSLTSVRANATPAYQRRRKPGVGL